MGKLHTYQIIIAMAKKSSNAPKQNPTKKMVPTKKETKQQKINLKKGKKL